MRMPLNHFQSGIDSSRIEGVRELADSASNRGNQAAFLKLPPGYVASPTRTPSDVLPKTEYFSGRDFYSVESLGDQSEVLDLTKFEANLGCVGLPE